MFSLLARLRAFTFLTLLLISFTFAREDTLFTSSVTYCNPPETLLVQQFDIAYFAKNQSVSFNISAASVQSNVNVTANLFLNVYGMNPVNFTLDLCTILNGALCPLPQYNFTGSDSVTLPKSLGVTDKIPVIAYKIPDLEGFAQLTLTEVGTGNIKACVQATLSNGWSAHQPAVEWSMRGVAIVALVSAAWQSISPEALAPFRALELIYLYQSVASSALLGLNYPSVYRAFALNFAWALGLFSSPTSPLQRSIDHMRHLTGGKLADASSGSAVGFVNRKLSPYNSGGGGGGGGGQTIGSLSLRDVEYEWLNLLAKPELPSSLSGLQQNVAVRTAVGGGDVQTVTADSSNVLQAGIPIYVNSINIATANAFMTIFICALIMFLIVMGIFIVGYVIMFIARHVKNGKQPHNQQSSFDYTSFTRSWILRLGLLSTSPLLIFVFYQWTLKDSWLSIFLSVLSLIAISGLILIPVYLTIRTARRSSAYSLYTDPSQHLSSYGPLYAQHRSERYYFSLIMLLAIFIKALLIAFAHSNGEVQVIIYLIVEAGLVLAYIVLKPAKSRGGDIFGTFLAIIRMVCTGLMIAFVERLEVKAIPRVVVGIVIAIVFSVSIIVMIINLIIHLGIGQLFRKNRGRHLGLNSGFSFSSHQRSEASTLEKAGVGEKVLGNSLSWEQQTAARPLNPTPTQAELQDTPYVLAPYPLSPTATTISNMEPPSLYSQESRSITVGSLLPRRWSFSYSQPSSPVLSSVAHSSSNGSGSRRASAMPSPMVGAEMETVTEEGVRTSGQTDRTVGERNDQRS